MAGSEMVFGVTVRGRRFPVASLLFASCVLGGSSALTGCTLPPTSGQQGLPGGGQAAGPHHGTIAPSYTYQPTPEQLAAQAGGAGRGGAGMVDPVAAVMQGTTQMGSPKPPVIRPTVEWGASMPPAAESAKSETVRDVYDAQVNRLDERIDATNGAAKKEPAVGGNTAMAVDTEDTAGPGDSESGEQEDSGVTPLYADPAMLSRGDLLVELRKRLATMDAPAVRRALSVSALSLADPGIELSTDITNDLTPEQAQAVQRYRSLLLEVAQRIDAGDITDLDAEEVAKAVSGMTGPQPVTIRNPTLCKRVSGFGVYEAFNTHEFIAGQENRMIIYGEVEHFATASAATDNGTPGFEVKLEQEVVLYNEADGLAVWRHDPQPVRDVSRRQRRDFWVVQMVSLPANLGVGKYRLKVRVSDLHGSTVDEATLPVRLIADESARTATPTEPTPQGQVQQEFIDALKNMLPDSERLPLMQIQP